MTVTKKLNGDTLTVCPVGRIDSTTTDTLGDFLAENFTADIKTLILDMSGVDFISSKGLRLIITVYKELNGRTLEITGANTSVTEVLTLSGFARFITVK